MDKTSHGPYGEYLPKEDRSASALLAGMVGLAAIGIFAVLLLLSGAKLGVGEDSDGLDAAGLSSLNYPATLALEISQPANGQWVLPADLAVVGDSAFVLDTENDRILKVDRSGRIDSVLDSASDERLVLRRPMAIATDGSRLFVASSETAEVVVLDLSGRVEAVLPLLPGAGHARAPRPIGLAIAPDGAIVLSDADNHRVLILDGDGTVLRTIGTGTRTGGSDGFNVPGAVAVDGAGNLYVVDILNGRVVKLSPDGTFLGQFGERGRTVGMLSRPKGVAVDPEGHVFVSDGMQAAVQVFDEDGTYLGAIGRRDPANPGAGSLFQAPAGLWLSDDELYVMDRMGGLIMLRLVGSSSADASTSGTEGG